MSSGVLLLATMETAVSSKELKIITSVSLLKGLEQSYIKGICNESRNEDNAYAALLKACARKKDLHEGTRLHGELLEKGMLHKSPHLSRSLVCMYTKCRALNKAKEVLMQTSNNDIVSWNALISGLVQQGEGQEALNCHDKMQSEGILPDVVTYICILKACGKMKAINKGKIIHVKTMNEVLLGKSIKLGNALLNMYVKCALLVKAWKILEELPVRDVVSWNILIAGYCQSGEINAALNSYEQMQGEGVNPDVVSFVCILKACGKVRAIDMGTQIHVRIIDEGLLENNVTLGTALLDMYAKCGMLSKAHHVLEELPVRNVVSWSALISEFSEQGQGREALNLFERMQIEGLLPDAVTFICILKACGCIGDINTGILIHEKLVRMALLENDVMLGTALVDMYIKCGMLAKAQHVLDELPAQSIASWSAVITGYVEEGLGHDALNCFECMQILGFCPDFVTFVGILNACGSIQALEKGKQIHNEIERMGFLGKDVLIGNALVNMYVKCGVPSKAQEVFEQLPCRNVGTWNALIAGYVQQKHDTEAMDCFEQMKSENIHPDAITFIFILKAYGRTGSLNEGKQIHREITSSGVMEKDIVLGTALIDMYSKCGMINDAQDIFKDLSFRDEISWNAFISCYLQQGQCHEAFNTFERMKREGLQPGVITFSCMLKACGSTGLVKKGIEVHEMILQRGVLDKDSVIGNALVDMYAKCGALGKAWQVFKQLENQGVVSWNALISGHVQQGQFSEAMKCFEKMQSTGISANETTYICTLKACESIGDIEKAQQIHNEIVRRNMLKTDIVLGTALMNIYVNNGMLTKAQEVLRELPICDVVLWNVLIAGYTQQDQCHDALTYFEYYRQNEGLFPDAVTFICILNACARIGAIETGKQIHGEIIKRGLLKDTMVGNALVDMYAKCGVPVKAQEIIEELPTRDVISWNSLILGYAQQGQSHEALLCFEWMQCEGIYPDEITCLCVLTACNRSGILDKAEVLYENMTTKYGIIPNIEHYTCMIAIFGCAGCFDKAISVIEVMPSSDYVAVWLVLLGACSKWGNVSLGKLAFDQAVQLNSVGAAGYVLMANIFATVGMQEDAIRIEDMKCKYLHAQGNRSHNDVSLFIDRMNIEKF